MALQLSRLRTGGSVAGGGGTVAVEGSGVSVVTVAIGRAVASSVAVGSVSSSGAAVSVGVSVSAPLLQANARSPRIRTASVIDAFMSASSEPRDSSIVRLAGVS